MGCYLALDNVSSVERISGSMEQLPLRAALMVAGDLNMNISDPEGVNWDKKKFGNYRTRAWRICSATSSCTASHGSGTGGHGARSGRAEGCVPGWINYRVVLPSFP